MVSFVDRVVLHVQAREVDREGERRVLLAHPSRFKGAGLLEHVKIEIQDAAAAFERGDERAGEIMPRSGCAQRTSASAPASDPSEGRTFGCR